jgi:tRNA(adenine34) deaminase
MNQPDPMEFDDDSWLLDQELEPLSDEHWMRQALKLAQQAAEQDEVPVGAIIVHENKIIASAFNQREQLADPTAHAEMIAITQAASHLNS